MSTVPEQNPQADSPQAREYNRVHRRLSLAGTLLGILLLIALLATGWTRDLRDVAFMLSGQRYGLAVFLYVLQLSLLSKALSWGLDYYSFRLEHSYQLSNQKLGAWLWDESKAWLLGLALAVFLSELLYFFIRSAPELWWLIAWAVFALLFVFFAQIAPVALFPLFYTFKPLEDEELKERLLQLSQRAHTRVRGVYEWKLSEKSKKANAALTGLGATRRIILADTLLQNYSADEIEAVLAHELGHHVRRHIAKSVMLHIAITLAGFYLADQALRYAIEQRRWFDSLADFANLPLLILLSTLLSLLLLPAFNAYSRRNEREADAFCWQSIPSVAPFISSMNKLCEQNLGERQPSRWVEWLFHSHPSVASRIAAAERFAANPGK